MEHTAKPAFRYGYALVRDLQMNPGPADNDGIPAVREIDIRGEKHRPTKRFWNSFFRRFRVSENVFRYFSHDEVLSRISERARDESFRYCVESREGESGRLLAVTSPEKAVIQYNELLHLTDHYDAIDCKYENGVVSSEHLPRSGDYPVNVGADEFRQRFILDTPIDGYGLPRIHLSMMRSICSNGMIGYAPAFRSEISVGKDVGYAVSRALDSFDNCDGYTALRQRFESAQDSWASIRETQELYKLLMGVDFGRAQKRDAVYCDFYRMIGRPHELYGLANLDALSVKRQRVLPAKCRVYDLLNFASEVGTHHLSASSNRRLQAYIGTLISDEYDLEGTGDQAKEFSDFIVSQN